MLTTSASSPSRCTSRSGSPADTEKRRAALIARLQVVKENLRRARDSGSESEEEEEEEEVPISPGEVVEVRRPQRSLVKSAAPSDSDEPVNANAAFSTQASDDEGRPHRSRPPADSWIEAARPCEHCLKSDKACEKSSNPRRTACQSCSQQKRQCHWPDSLTKKAKRGPTRSPKAKDDSEQAPEFSVTPSVQEHRREVKQILREIEDLRAVLADLKSGQVKIVAQHADAEKQMERLEALLRCLLIGNDDMDIGA